MSIFLQIFLYVDVFIIGLVSAIAIRHGYAHFRPPKESVEPKAHKQINNDLPLAMREKLLEQSSAKFQHIIDHSASVLEHDLSITGEKINTTTKKLAAEIITKELEGFQAMFKQYQEQAVKELEGAKTETDQYRVQLKNQAEQDINLEKQRLLSLIDTKLSDWVMSFLLEAMQHEIDLGSQSDYLIKQLEAHKAELKQAIIND